MPGISITEASGVADSIYGKIQAPLRMFLIKRGEAYEQMSMLPHLFGIGKSNGFGEMSSGLTAFDDFEPVGENGTYPITDFREGFQKLIVHDTWKSSFSISREMVDDATVMNLRQRPENFVASYYRTRERFGARLYGAGITGSTTVTVKGHKYDVTGADGQPLFSKTHPSVLDASFTQSNQFADAFSAKALGAMETAMQNFQGDNGEVLDITPDTILIPNLYELKEAVFAAIGADKDPTTSNNAFNYLFGRWNVIVWPYLNQYITAGTSPWVLLDSRYINLHGAAPWYNRVDLEVKSSIDEGNDANKWRGYARWGAGFVDWRFAAVGGVSGGDTLVSSN